MSDEKLRHAMQSCLSGVTFSPERQQAVLRAVRESSISPLRRKLPLGVVLALLLALLITGGAVAAGFGVFGWLAGHAPMIAPQDELKRLDEAASIINQQVTSSLETSAVTVEPRSDYEALLAAYDAQPLNCTLTLNQAYCDSRRLSYSYTVRRNESAWFRGVGMPTGIDQFTSETMGMTYQACHPEDPLAQTISAWLDSHDSSWIAYTTVAIGDGADLADGTDMEVVEGDNVLLDGLTSRGFYTVVLPEGYDPGDTISFQLTVMSGMHLIAQDETGIYEYVFPFKRQRFTFTAPVSRDAVTFRGSAQFDQYSATAELSMSQVTMTGTILLDVPATWHEALHADNTTIDHIILYTLVADGKEMMSYDSGGPIRPDGKLVIQLQFDLPPESATLFLRPQYLLSGSHPEEDILLTLDQQ